MAQPGGVGGTPGWRRLTCTALLGVHASMLCLGSLATLLMLVLSMFEGGDVAWKHRVQAWAPLALVLQLVTIALLLVAAVAVARDRPTGPIQTWMAAVLVLVLAGGWGWVGLPHVPGSHKDGRSLVVIWLTWTIPALIAAGLVPHRGDAWRDRGSSR